MTLRSVPVSLSLAWFEERALRRLQSDLGEESPQGVLRTLLRVAHADVCPDPEVDAGLAAVATAREDMKARPKGRAVERRKIRTRACANERCGRGFEVPGHNRAQKFCCRACYTRARAAGNAGPVPWARERARKLGRV